MAKMKNGILEGLSGAIGPVVAYQWKGRDCLRAREVARNDPRTPRQQACRRTFGVASQLASAMLPAAALGFRLPAEEGKTTERGCFMHVNSQCFSLVDGEVSIDYPAIKVAQGTLTGVRFASPQTCEGGTVSVAFHSEEGGDASDYVLLFAYSPTARCGVLSLPAGRHQGVVTIDPPRFWTGHTLYLYGFAWDRRRLSASDSVFLGTVDLTS